MVQRGKPKGKLGVDIGKMLDAAGLTLSQAAQRANIPLRTLQNWERRDELPGTELARERWEKLVTVCTPSGEDAMHQGPQHFQWINDTPPAAGGDRDFLTRVKGIEEQMRDLLEELIVLRRDIAAAKRKRKMA